jgi:hypothetical protein
MIELIYIQGPYNATPKPIPPECLIISPIPRFFQPITLVIAHQVVVAPLSGSRYEPLLVVSAINLMLPAGLEYLKAPT